jgi:hypothetical protein
MLRLGTILLVLLLICARQLPAQPASITGTICDLERGEPLGNANVFLADTPFGTGSGPDGRYRLGGIPPGVYTLVVSLVGYEVHTQQIVVHPADTLHSMFYLKSRILQSEEIQAIAPSQMEWKKLLKAFTREFLGETSNANNTRILNPEILTLWREQITRELIGSADSVLRVENLALGYRLSIVLSKFKWDVDDGSGQYLIFPRFEELSPPDPVIREEWRESRQRTYLGSLRHFLRALAFGNLEHEGFTIHQGNITALSSGQYNPVTIENLVLSRVERSAMWKLSFEGWLRVEYHGKRSRTSYICLNGGVAVFDEFGGLVNPVCFETSGDWLEDRVAEMLPRTYHE